MPARRGCFFLCFPMKGRNSHGLQDPSPAVFAGPDSAHFKAGARYEEWVPNDFSVVRGQDGWHLLGITHPRPPRFRQPKDVPPEIHEAEWPVLHLGDNAARDPNLFEDEEGYGLVFLKSDGLYLSRSTDLKHFDEPICLFKNRADYSIESPILKKIDGWYYLFFCIYDDDDRINGAYDFRTFVYAARTLEELNQASVEWPHRGVSIAPLVFEEQPPQS